MTTDTSHSILPVEHNPLASMPHDSHGGLTNPVLGMLLFITSEVMFFGGLFAAYFSVRANAAQWPPEQFQETLRVLPFVGPATFLLILSSVSCQYAVWAIRRDDRTVFFRAMTVTVVLGITFLLMQAADYALLGSEGLTLSSGTFGTTYYTLTGFHGAHVFGGVIMLSGGFMAIPENAKFDIQGRICKKSVHWLICHRLSGRPVMVETKSANTILLR